MSPSHVLAARVLTGAGLWLAVIAAAVPAHAQLRPERPYRGLFASGGVTDAEQSLVGGASLGVGVDSNVVASALFGDRTRISDMNTPMRGGVGQASGSLDYSLSLDAITLGASGSTTVHYYPSFASEFLRRYHGDVGASVRLTRELSANASVTYGPYNLSSLFGPGPRTTDIVLAQDVDLASSVEHYFSTGAGLGYRRRLSSRTELTADYSFQTRNKTAYTGLYRRHGIGGGLRFDMGRGLAMRAGYRYSDVDYGVGEREFQNHLIDAGVDYNRALSFSRRTVLSFSTGTSATSNPERPEERTRFLVTGGAELTHELARTWHASVAYSRGVRLDATWGDIVSSDSVTASLGGLMNRKWQFVSSVRASTGKVGLSGDDGFDHVTGQASLGYALSRNLNLALSYGYYRHRFDRAVALPSDFSQTFNRQSLRVTINFWSPIFQRARRTNAAR